MAHKPRATDRYRSVQRKLTSIPCWRVIDAATFDRLLVCDDRLLTIGQQNVEGMPYPDVLSIMKQGVRPVTMAFRLPPAAAAPPPPPPPAVAAPPPMQPAPPPPAGMAPPPPPPAAPAELPKFSGWLGKKSPKPGGKLQMRWFVLEDAKLSYYKEKDAKTMVSPLRDPPLLVTSRSFQPGIFATSRSPRSPDHQLSQNICSHSPDTSACAHSSSSMTRTSRDIWTCRRSRRYAKPWERSSTRRTSRRRTLRWTTTALARLSLVRHFFHAFAFFTRLRSFSRCFRSRLPLLRCCLLVAWSCGFLCGNTSMVAFLCLR